MLNLSVEKPVGKATFREVREDARTLQLGEMQAAAAISMLHTQVYRQRRTRENIERETEERQKAEESARSLKEERDRTERLKRTEVNIIQSQISAQRLWLEDKERIRRKPLTDVEKQVRKARATIKCWPNVSQALENEISKLQTELLPSSEERIAQLFVLIKSTMIKCEEVNLRTDQSSFSLDLAANEPAADLCINEMLSYVEFFQAYLLEHDREVVQNELNSLTPDISQAQEEYDETIKSVAPLRETVSLLRAAFDLAMTPVRDELAATVVRLAGEVEACEQLQVATLASLEEQLQLVEQAISNAERDTVRAQQEEREARARKQEEQKRIKGLQEQAVRVEAERARSVAAAKADRRHTVLRRRVVTAFISARADRQASSLCSPPPLSHSPTHAPTHSIHSLSLLPSSTPLSLMLRHGILSAMACFCSTFTRPHAPLLPSSRSPSHPPWSRPHAPSSVQGSILRVSPPCAYQPHEHVQQASLPRATRAPRVLPAQARHASGAHSS